MPELKRVPQAGKMNRDFHERILPPGEYREALNVNIGRSETSEVGTVENILGNEQVMLFTETFTFLFELNLTSSTIVNLTASSISQLELDGFASVFGTPNFTMGVDEITFRTTKAVLIDYPEGQILIPTNTNLQYLGGQEIEFLLDHEGSGQHNHEDVEFIGAPVNEDSKVIGSYRDNGQERIFYFITTNERFDEDNSEFESHLVIEFDQKSGRQTVLIDSNELNFHKSYPITGVNLVDELLLWTDNRNEPRKINVDRARQDKDFYSSDDTMALIKVAPYEPARIFNIGEEIPAIPAVGDEPAVDAQPIDSEFLRNKLPRFTYRWRFNDGEYSVLAPFTPIIFSRLDKGISFNTDNIENSGEVPDFYNAVKYVAFQIPTPVGAGITSVELIYKESTTSTMYIVEDKPVTNVSSVNFDYVSQDPFRTVPPSQLTRVSDAVPRKAKSQEVAGGRVVFGNYLQNFNLPLIDFSVKVNDEAPEEPYLPNFSVKSRRTYQVGIVLADKYGRTTPVILSNSANDSVYVSPLTGGDAFQRLSINFADNTQLEGFESYRIVVKQREQEYYNWLSDSTAANTVSRNGDNINKIPRDTTAEDPGNANVSPVNTSVYPKVISGVNQISELIKVQSIANPSGVATVPGAAGSFIVYETEPFQSELNIFYETSTGGLIEDISSNTEINISFYNCYIINLDSFHIEANRLRLGFNEPFFDVGVRAHVVNEEYGGEERRLNALIHSSGFFNSRTGLNYLNQFNEAEGGITISLDPADGSIQKLYAEDTQLIIWQEDKVSRSPIDKDFIYSAEGGAIPVTSSSAYLGTIAAYSGEYGISTDPGSFAVYGTAKYFTDRNRGVVLRLSNDGLTEISRYGMADFFRDAMKDSLEIIGSFSEYHNEYNLTIVGEAYDRREDTNVATGAQGYFTISYDDDTKGWPSFKSFQQEGGTTLNNRYYTFNSGSMWLHDSQISDRNTFYGNPTEPSYVDFIFNDGPSSVKDFKTLGYEGKAGWECVYIETDIDSVGDTPIENIGYVDVTLDVIAVDAEEVIFNGERTNQAKINEDTFFTLVISPSSSQYELDDLADIDLTVVNADVIGDARLFEGEIFYRLRVNTDVDTRVEVTIGGVGAGLAFDVALLIVNIFSGEVIGGQISTASTLTYNTEGDTDIPITFSRFSDDDRGRYFDADDLTFDLTDLGQLQDPNFIPVADLIDFFNVSYTVPITVPDTPGSGSITITGTASFTPALTWVLTQGDSVGFTSTLFQIEDDGYLIPPRDTENDARTANVNSEIDSDSPEWETDILIIDDVIVAVTNGAESGMRTITSNLAIVTFGIETDMTTEDTTTTVDVSGSSVPAALADFDDISNINGLGEDWTFTNNSNIDVALTPTSLDGEWTGITFFSDHNLADTIVAAGESRIFTAEPRGADSARTDAIRVVAKPPSRITTDFSALTTFNVQQNATP